MSGGRKKIQEFWGRIRCWLGWHDYEIMWDGWQYCRRCPYCQDPIKEGRR